jgi:hypothetical protein
LCMIKNGWAIFLATFSKNSFGHPDSLLPFLAPTRIVLKITDSLLCVLLFVIKGSVYTKHNFCAVHHKILSYDTNWKASICVVPHKFSRISQIYVSSKYPFMLYLNTSSSSMSRGRSKWNNSLELQRTLFWNGLNWTLWKWWQLKMALKKIAQSVAVNI